MGFTRRDDARLLPSWTGESMKKLLASVAMVVFALVSLGAGVVAEAAQKRSESGKTATKTSLKKSATRKSPARKSSLSKSPSRKKAAASRLAKSKRKAVVSSKTIAKKRATKRRASARAKRRVASAPRLAKLPKARSAPGALSLPRLPESGSDERVLAARAYAMDGATFYQGGKRIRVKGIDARARDVSTEHAKQRLQRLLDSGRLQVEPVAADPAGNMLSVVKVNGRDVADMVHVN